MEQNNNHHEDTEPVLLNRTTDNQTDTVPSTSSAQPKAKGFWRDLFETILMALVLFVLLNAITSRVKVFNISINLPIIGIFHRRILFFTRKSK